MLLHTIPLRRFGHGFPARVGGYGFFRGGIQLARQPLADHFLDTAKEKSAGLHAADYVRLPVYAFLFAVR